MTSAGARGVIGLADDLARQASEWLLERCLVRDGDMSLYHGAAGVMLALAEAAEHFNDDRYHRAGHALADTIGARIDEVDDSSLYFGLAGIGGALRSMGRPDDAERALSRVRTRFDGERWGEMFELLAGNAGIALGAMWVGDLDLAVDAVTPYLRTADPTPGGVNWQVRPSPPRSHHIAHGTLGIVYALAAVGRVAQREDMVTMALAGAADVVSRNEEGPVGFLVPHSDPPHRPDLIERYSFGWCNGPAGDAQVFRLLAEVTGDPRWTALVDACWRTVTSSGLPARARPGFWDNNGRCCGTAGVLALACDRIVERGDPAGFAEVLVRDLAQRATIDGSGARWSNTEHRASRPQLPPDPGWAKGNAGIIPELLRFVRLHRDGSPAYAVQWPDHPVALTQST